MSIVLPCVHVSHSVFFRPLPQAKLLQLMTGLSLRLYWFSNFLFDFMHYMVYCVMLCLLFFCWDRYFVYDVYFVRFTSTGKKARSEIEVLFGCIYL